MIHAIAAKDIVLICVNCPGIALHHMKLHSTEELVQRYLELIFNSHGLRAGVAIIAGISGALASASRSALWSDLFLLIFERPSASWHVENDFGHRLFLGSRFLFCIAAI